MEIDIKKILGESPKNEFEAIDLMNKAQQELLEALHIMQSCIAFPQYDGINTTRMLNFLAKYSKNNN